MSKYKVGDKFVVEIKSEEKACGQDEAYYLIVTNKRPHVVSEGFLDCLEKVEKRKADLEAIRKKAHEDGMNEAWEIARRLYLTEIDDGICVEDVQKIFECKYFRTILKDNTAQQAKSKIEAWERSKEEFQVGDVVKDIEDDSLVILITYIDEENKEFSGFQIYDDRVCGTQGHVFTECMFKEFKQTGKHYDMSKLFGME